MTTSNKSGKLLVVDSSTAMLHVLKNFTSKHGYVADHFSDPADACKRLDQRFQDFSSDYRSVVLGWPEGRLNLVQDLLHQLGSADHDDLPLIIITQEMNVDVLALIKRRPRTRAFLWSDYQQVADVIDLTARHRSNRSGTIAVRQAAPGHQNSSDTSGAMTSSPNRDIAIRDDASVGSKISTTDYSASFSLLLVDTAPSICESLRGKLESAGYQVSVAATVPEAEELLVDGEFDIVVTDFFLRDESGEALCRRLQASGSDSRPVCVVLTAKYSDSIVKRSLSVGAAACLFKNESTDLLFARIDALTQTIRRQSRQLPRQPSRQAVQQPSQQLAAGPEHAVNNGVVKEGRTASLHTATQTELQPAEKQTSGTVRRGGVKLAARPLTQKPVDVLQTPRSVPAVTHQTQTKTMKTQPSDANVDTDVSNSVPTLLAQLETQHSSAKNSVLMLDVEIVAATGDRIALFDSKPMHKLVARSLRRVYPKQKALACTEDGKFVLLLTTSKFQDALVLTRKILQIIPQMVPYLNNMSLITHAGIVRVESDSAIDQAGLISQCEAACQKTRDDRRDNTALVLPDNRYLSAVLPEASALSEDLSAAKSDVKSEEKNDVSAVKDTTSASAAEKVQLEHLQTA